MPLRQGVTHMRPEGCLSTFDLLGQAIVDPAGGLVPFLVLDQRGDGSWFITANEDGSTEEITAEEAEFILAMHERDGTLKALVGHLRDHPVVASTFAAPIIRPQTRARAPRRRSVAVGRARPAPQAETMTP